MTSSNLNCLFCNNVFHWKGPIGPNMFSKIYNILCQYHICIKFDNQRIILLTFNEFFFSRFGMLMKFFNLKWLIL